jgi:aerobic-type carbon monoxide dehydrogenase small subunit (CoxS/CutS family)
MKIKVNGRDYKIGAKPWRTLLDVLRNELGFIGTKEGCGTGSCGSCTVLMDGQAVNACLVLVAEAKGKAITTIEGLSREGKLHPLQQAFMDEGAVQCGFCTPGMILTAKAFLDLNPNPSESQIREAISGNLCRCTGYDKIVRAIMTTAQTKDQGRV